MTENNTHFTSGSYRGLQYEVYDHCIGIFLPQLSHGYAISAAGGKPDLTKLNSGCGAHWEEAYFGQMLPIARGMEIVRNQIDRMYVSGIVLPVSEPWTPSADAVAVSIDAQQLAAQIHSMDDARHLAQSIDNPAIQAFDGIPLLAWRYDTIAGCIRFVRLGVAGEVTQVVVAVNAPESRRAEFVPENTLYADRQIVVMAG